LNKGIATQQRSNKIKKMTMLHNLMFVHMTLVHTVNLFLIDSSADSTDSHFVSLKSRNLINFSLPPGSCIKEV